ncbi:hypothetical protein BJ165DRAFT_1407831 [Panaeolus papilionaceus]|nr:hypothetical protein BJ165DRAFT_1407831 [Panaeolus papilionaceus]
MVQLKFTAGLSGLLCLLMIASMVSAAPIATSSYGLTRRTLELDVHADGAVELRGRTLTRGRLNARQSRSSNSRSNSRSNSPESLSRSPSRSNFRNRFSVEVETSAIASEDAQTLELRGRSLTSAGRDRGNATATATVSASASATATNSASATATATVPAPPPVEGEGNEVVQDGTFDVPIALGGGNVKTDTEFKSDSGKFEVEFQSPDANTLTVSKKVATGLPPTGFSFLDTNSFTVKVDQSTATASLLKIDYIFDATASLIAGVDTSKAVIGKLCTETNVFVVDNLGELEFEDEENEVFVKVKDLTGEWAVLAPTSAFKIDAAKQAAEGKTELPLQATFNTALQFPGGNLKTDLLFPPSAAGGFEVEHTGVSPASITVTAQTPSAAPPTGFVFVDPQSFVVNTSDTTGSSLLKIDYIFTDAVKAAVDASKGVIGKFDAASKQFVTANLGEFEFEADENEWTLTVSDLNGEWAVLVPSSAVL